MALREQVVVDQPLLCVDRQMGMNIVHPEGKVCISSLYAVSHSRYISTPRLYLIACSMTPYPTRVSCIVGVLSLRLGFSRLKSPSIRSAANRPL